MTVQMKLYTQKHLAEVFAAKQTKKTGEEHVVVAAEGGQFQVVAKVSLKAGPEAGQGQAQEESSQEASQPELDQEEPSQAQDPDQAEVLKMLAEEQAQLEAQEQEGAQGEQAGKQEAGQTEPAASGPAASGPEVQEPEANQEPDQQKSGQQKSGKPRPKGMKTVQLVFVDESPVWLGFKKVAGAPTQWLKKSCLKEYKADPDLGVLKVKAEAKYLDKRGLLA